MCKRALDLARENFRIFNLRLRFNNLTRRRTVILSHLQGCFLL